MIISSEAKLGSRAAIAVAIVLWIEHAFHLNHGYWAVLTTIALISATWGESLQRAYTRFGMTIGGCIVGYLIVLLLGNPKWLILSMLLSGIFGMAYFFVVSYAWAMFFVGINVVALFTYLGGWTLDLLWQRTYETALGCLVAAIVSGLFMPIYSRQKFAQELPEVMRCFKNLYTSLTSMASKHQAPSLAENTQHLNELFNQIRVLKKDYGMAKYEMLIMLQQHGSMDVFLPRLEVCFHYLSSLATVLRQLSGKPIYAYFQLELQDLWDHLSLQFEQIQLALDSKPTSALNKWEESFVRYQLREKFYLAKHNHQFSPDEMMNLTACVYYGRMLDKSFREMLGAFSQK